MKYQKVFTPLLGLCMAFMSSSVQADHHEKTNYMHSFASPNVVVTHMDLDLNIDFDARVLRGWVALQIENPKKLKELRLDSKDMTIKTVALDKKNKKTKFSWGKSNDMGKELIIAIKSKTKTVWVEYETSPKAEALQWMTAAQTLDKKMPFLYSQGQTIFTRTWIPSQDTPALRVTYTAKMSVNNGTTVVMAADKVEMEKSKKKKTSNTTFMFEMKQAIPTYLIAFAAGGLAFEKISDRVGVWAEPSMVKKAAKEYEDTQKMMNVTEDLYGPYAWGRYDLLVLPPSFPMGGMENPKLTFVNPTTIVGDKSLVAIISHELAHSWSGNLVTNKTWEDFWLNEGTTTYIQRRILEAMYGKKAAELDAFRGQQNLWEDINNKGKELGFKKLQTDLKNKNPEAAFSNIPYEKGYWFLVDLESRVGRPAFDAFLKKYFSDYAFKTITTKEFESYVTKNLLNKFPKAKETFALKQWLYETAIPTNAIAIESDILKMVDQERLAFLEGEKAAKDIDTSNWSWVEWTHFFYEMPKEVSTQKLYDMYSTFDLANNKNSEVLSQWFKVAINNNYTPVYSKVENFLMDVGRLKFIAPLYKQLNEVQPKRANSIYKKARAGYHPMSQKAIERILDKKG